MEILLLSTGGRPFLKHAASELCSFLDNRRRIGFVTAAELRERESDYLALARSAFKAMDSHVTVRHVRWDRPTPLDGLDAIMVGGGNTYALLHRLRSAGLLDRIRAAVRRGLPYIGASAGSNIVGPNACTTNDMPPYEQLDLRAMGLVPFNVNPHYPASLQRERGRAMHSETRNERIAEFHVIQTLPVAALEEFAMIRVHGDVATVSGRGRVRWITREDRRWFLPGQALPISVPM